MVLDDNDNEVGVQVDGLIVEVIAATAADAEDVAEDDDADNNFTIEVATDGPEIEIQNGNNDEEKDIKK